MNNTKSVIAAIMFAGAALTSQAVLAADISAVPEPLVLIDGTADFGSSFAAGNMGNTFMNQFTFSTVGVNAVDSLVSSISRTAVVGLDITGFDLFGAGGGLVAAGEQLGTGSIDLWSLTANGLAEGNYYVQVSGTMVSTGSGSFGANLNLAPVPEPETYGMMLAGLGILGMLSRRRKNSSTAA